MHKGPTLDSNEAAASGAGRYRPTARCISISLSVRLGSSSITRVTRPCERAMLLSEGVLKKCRLGRQALVVMDAEVFVAETSDDIRWSNFGHHNSHLS